MTETDPYEGEPAEETLPSKPPLDIPDEDAEEPEEAPVPDEAFLPPEEADADETVDNAEQDNGDQAPPAEATP